MKKLISLREAVNLIKNESVVGVSGFGSFASPDSIFDEIGRKFEETGSPSNLTLVSGVAPGDFDEDGCGLSKIKHEGIIDTLIASHLRMSPPIGRAINQNKIAAYTMPLGVYGQLMCAIGANRPGVITKVGLNTFADPRVEGIAINEKAKNKSLNLVRVLNIDGEDYLFYKAFKIDTCIVKATYADEEGNISLEEEPIRGEILELVSAVHNTGGTVIVEVKDIVKSGSLRPTDVLIHKSFVDYVTKSTPQKNPATKYIPEIQGKIKVPTKGYLENLELDIQKIIARRAALELKNGSLVNLGIGIPAKVASIANEEDIINKITLSLETGIYGGVPLNGPLFGASINPDSISRSLDMFMTYDGGGLDYSVLGAAIIDETGNVNVSKFSGNCVGPGGFVDISQNTKKISFAFTFTAGKHNIIVENGKLNIIEDGETLKFKKDVEHITFSSKYALETNQEVLFITERCVFKLTNKGLELIEIAPGVDIDKDIMQKMEFRPKIAKNVKLMDSRIFEHDSMGMSL